MTEQPPPATNAPDPTGTGRHDVASGPGQQADFVSWLRMVAPYIHAFRGRTFVIGIAGELIAEGRLNALVNDISLLNAMGMRIVLVHGSRPQVIEQLRLHGLEGQYHDHVRITDEVALECAKEASGELRLDIEAAFSQGLPNTPMAHSTVRVVSGNLVTARPVGVIGGVDHLHTGMVRKVDTETIRFALSSGSVVLISPLGFSPTGELFNLSMEDVAAKTAIALDADKLIFLGETDGIVHEGRVLGEISEEEARHLLASGTLDPAAEFYLRHAAIACDGGVARAHIVPFRVDGSLLLELFRHDGVGTMLVEETLEALRDATIDDVGGILALIRPMEEEGILVPRDHTLIERDVDKFSVIEHDGVIFGCAALYVREGEDLAEMACLAVRSSAQGQGDGERLLRRLELRARSQGVRRLYVLTTRTMHWFLKRGFVEASPEDLPANRRDLYNWQRRSKVLIKNL